MIVNRSNKAADGKAVDEAVEVGYLAHSGGLRWWMWWVCCGADYGSWGECGVVVGEVC